LTVSLSVVVVLGIAVMLLCRHAGLRLAHAVVCIVLDSIGRAQVRVGRRITGPGISPGPISPRSGTGSANSLPK